MTAQVHRDDRVPFLVGHVRKHPVADDTGVVDDDVEAAEPIHCGGDHCVSGLSFGDTAGHELGVDPQRPDLREGVVHRVTGSEIVDDHPRAGTGETECLGASESRTGTGDDRNLAFERHIVATVADSTHSRTPLRSRAGHPTCPHPWPTPEIRSRPGI